LLRTPQRQSSRVLDDGDAYAPLEADAIVAGYRIEEEIGKGGMVVTHRASQTAVGREVALKLILA
jgi:hypothetical protein